MAHALHNMRTDVCGQGSVGLCDEMRPPNMDAFFEYLTNVSFKGKIILILLLFLLLLLIIIITIIITIIIIIIIIILYFRAVSPTVYIVYYNMKSSFIFGDGRTRVQLNVKLHTN